MRRSRLPSGGRNLFQMVRAKRAEAAARGVELLDLSIGEPRGAALPSARQAAARAVLSEDEAMHSYQYNAGTAVPDFARRFVQALVGKTLDDSATAFLPISGIKPSLGLLPLACGCAEQPLKVGTMTRPGYPSPADWCGLLTLTEHYPLRLTLDNAFRFDCEDIEDGTQLLMVNFPHNPTGQVATEDWMRALCEHCVTHDIRLFNDAAYCALVHGGESVMLSQVAQDYPQLSWCEAFTAAKLIGNGTGWHVGAIAGSSDFIADLQVVKGKLDTGLVAPMAAGALATLEHDADSITRFREIYERRLELLIETMTRHGMRLAHRPTAGFFTLWGAPTHAFGRAMADSQDFNFAMIDETGIAGVHFPGFVRYAVCADIEAAIDKLDAGFALADVGYE